MQGFDGELRQRGGVRETCSKGLRARLFLRAAEAEACSGRRGEAASRGESTNINHRAPGSSSGSGVELIGARDVALAAAPVGWGEGASTEPRIESGGEVFGQQLPSTLTMLGYRNSYVGLLFITTVNSTGQLLIVQHEALSLECNHF